MANTYIKIATNTLGSSTSTVTFSSIPSIYQDLVVRASVRVDATQLAQDFQVTVNGLTGTIYSDTIMYANGDATTISYTNTNATSFSPTATAATTSANVFANIEIYIPNYALATNKQVRSISQLENDGAAGRQYTNAHYIRNGTAISSITFTAFSNFVAGSSFYLYGIKNS